MDRGRRPNANPQRLSDTAALASRPVPNHMLPPTRFDRIPDRTIMRHLPHGRGVCCGPENIREADGYLCSHPKIVPLNRNKWQ